MNTMKLLMVLILPFVGAFVGWGIGRKSEKMRDVFNIALTGVVVVLTLSLYPIKGPIHVSIDGIMGTGLDLKLDRFRYIFLCISAVLWFLITIYSTQYLIRYKNRNRYYMFFMLTLFSTIGIFLSENIINLFTFFEIMSFTSYALIIHDEDAYALDAGKIYIFMAIGGGMILLMGLFLLYQYTGVYNISDLKEKMIHLGGIKYVISTLIIIGFGVKASIFPLHIWVPKVYPAAPTPASAILSGVLLKTGLFGIWITTQALMQGDFMVCTIILMMGLVNMVLGGVFAVFQRNIKRILAYSGMSQAGYILVGIGLSGIIKDTGLGLYATLYHIVNHAIFKVLLFMGTGIIYMLLADVSINKIKGFGKHKPVLKFMFFIGVVGIMGVPGFNGYVSKTLLHEALKEIHFIYPHGLVNSIEVLFNIGSSLTVCYMLKIFVTVFVEENDQYYGQFKSYITTRAKLPMVFLSVLAVYIGINPYFMDGYLKKAISDLGYSYTVYPSVYHLEPIKESLLPIIIGAVLYVFIVRKYLIKKEGTKTFYVNPSLGWMNLEQDVYKPFFIGIFKSISHIFHAIDSSVVRSVCYMNEKMKGVAHISIYKGKKDRKDDLSIGAYAQKRYQQAGGLLYSVFVVGVVLVVSLGVLIF